MFKDNKLIGMDQNLLEIFVKKINIQLIEIVAHLIHIIIIFNY